MVTEIELSGELNTGIIPGGKLAVRLKQTWGDRATEYAETIEDTISLSREAIEDRCVTDPRVGDVFASTLERVVRVGDTFYRAALARLVSAAFDDAAIDEVEILADQITQLTPVDVRLLAAIYSDDAQPGQRVVLYYLDGSGPELANEQVEVALERLASFGFVERELRSQDPPEPIEQTVGSTRRRSTGFRDKFGQRVRTNWNATAWGVRAFELCLAHRRCE